MTISAARKFLAQAIRDEAFRDRLNTAAGGEQRAELLAARGLRFTQPEFEEAWRNELTKCQTEDAANRLYQLRDWWLLLSRWD